MRILQVITKNELGGAQSVVAHLANELSKDKEVMVAAGEGDGKFFSLLNPAVKTVTVKHLYRRISLFNDILAIYEMYKLNRQYRPDIIHLHSTKAGLLGRIAFPRKRIVYTVHGFDSVRIAFRSFLPIEKIMQWFCCFIVGVSKYDKDNLISEGIKHNVTYVYNGIPNNQKVQKLEVPNKYVQKVLCIARISPQKNLHLFLEIAKELPEVAFVWIGNQHVINNHSENVFFLGNIPNAGEYNQDVDLFILPSNYEGLPMVIIEAMSYGKPIVASDVGGINEIVRNGVNGYVVENEVKIFVEKIKEILYDKNKKDLFGKNSLKIFEEELTVEKMVEGYKMIYKKILYLANSGL